MVTLYICTHFIYRVIALHINYFAGQVRMSCYLLYFVGNVTRKISQTLGKFHCFPRARQREYISVCFRWVCFLFHESVYMPTECIVIKNKEYIDCCGLHGIIASVARTYICPRVYVFRCMPDRIPFEMVYLSGINQTTFARTRTHVYEGRDKYDFGITFIFTTAHARIRTL